MSETINKEIEEMGWGRFVKALFYLIGDRKWACIFWLVLRFLTFFYVVIPPLIVGLTVDFFNTWKPGEPLTKFYIYAGILGVVSVVLLTTRSTTKRYLLFIRNDAYYNIKVKGFKKLVALSLKDHRDENTGAKAQKIQNGVLAFRTFIRILENKIFSAVATFSGIVFVFIFLGPIYIIFFAIYLFLFFILLKYYYKRIQECNYKHNISKEKASGVYIEGLSNILSIKSAGVEDSFSEHISNKEEVTRSFGNQEVNIIMNQWTLFHILNGTSTAVFLFLIGQGIVAGTISIGSIVIFFSYLERLILSSADIISVYQDFIETKNGIVRMMPIFWNNYSYKTGEEAFPENWQELRLENASFNYKKKEQTKFYSGVKNINLKIKKYEKIGFAGKTGSGKSTLAKLLITLYELNSGKYEIDTKNFYNIKNDEIYNNISIVLQETEMFNFSLKDNIALMQKFDKVLFDKAVKIAQLEEALKKLPQGVDTLIGERGYHLSGGERQRVGIARAIYRNAQIMIFDEATSSLDNRTEKRIQEALEKELTHKTLIFIAHRVSTLKSVDKIYVFKDGNIVEEGKYEELINNYDSVFYQLNKKQASHK